MSEADKSWNRGHETGTPTLFSSLLDIIFHKFLRILLQNIVNFIHQLIEVFFYFFALFHDLGIGGDRFVFLICLLFFLFLFLLFWHKRSPHVAIMESNSSTVLASSRRRPTRAWLPFKGSKRGTFLIVVFPISNKIELQLAA